MWKLSTASQDEEATLAGNSIDSDSSSSTGDESKFTHPSAEFANRIQSKRPKSSIPSFVRVTTTSIPEENQDAEVTPDPEATPEPPTMITNNDQPRVQEPRGKLFVLMFVLLV